MLNVIIILLLLMLHPMFINLLCPTMLLNLPPSIELDIHSCKIPDADVVCVSSLYSNPNKIIMLCPALLPVTNLQKCKWISLLKLDYICIFDTYV